MKQIPWSISALVVAAAWPRPAWRQLVCLGAGLLLASEARATFHTWKINEIYSNADGSVQFIELHESLSFNGENLLATHFIQCVSGTLTNSFTFPTNLPSNTANKTFLISTANLAFIPGGVPVNYVFTNATPFLFPGSGTINYAGFDIVPYANLPSDGTASLVRSGSAMVFAAKNSPVNFAGASNSIVPVKFASAVRSGTNIVLTLATATGTNGTAGPNYAVQTNSVLGSTNWGTFTNLAGNGAVKTIATPIHAPRQFFRLRVP
jgi:hypothetical protein